MLELLLKDKLRELRSDMDLTQEEVGKLLHLSRQGYAHYEQGKRNPNNQMLLKISKLYKVAIGDLINSDTTPIDVEIIQESEAYIKIKQDPKVAQTNRRKQVSSDNRKLIKKYNKLSTLEKESIHLHIDNILKQNKGKNEES